MYDFPGSLTPEIALHAILIHYWGLHQNEGHPCPDKLELASWTSDITKSVGSTETKDLADTIRELKLEHELKKKTQSDSSILDIATSKPNKKRRKIDESSTATMDSDSLAATNDGRIQVVFLIDELVKFVKLDEYISSANRAYLYFHCFNQSIKRLCSYCSPSFVYASVDAFFCEPVNGISGNLIK